MARAARLFCETGGADPTACGYGVGARVHWVDWPALATQLPTFRVPLCVSPTKKECH